MKRKAFVPPRLLGQPGPTPHQPTAAATSPASAAAFDCLFKVQHKKGVATAEGTLVLRGARGKLYDLQLREQASGTLPAAVAAALHAAHKAAVAALAAGQPLGSLWQQLGADEAPDITMGQYKVMIEDERDVVVQEAEWQLRQRVGEEARGGKPKDAAGAEIPADNLGEEHTTARRGWLEHLQVVSANKTTGGR